MSQRLPPNLLPDGYKIKWLPTEGQLVCSPKSEVTSLPRVIKRTLKDRINGLFCKLERAHEFKNDMCVTCRIQR